MWENLFRKKSVDAILNEAKNNEDSIHGNGGLKKTLKLRDLTSFGIAAIIGAGIFSTIGNASADGGPAVVFLFLFTALACSFAAFAYAEFASMVPVSGSAYTYSYVAFGELVAWIIGWSLIMEYAIGNITVAIAWSGYLTRLLASGGIDLPGWISNNFITVAEGYDQAVALMDAGRPFEKLDSNLQFLYNTWTDAPQFLGLHIIFDLPALGIIIFITWLVYRGMKESRNASNAMVIVKLAVILLVIVVGVFYVDTDNWAPFSPNGVSGVLKGVSALFFAYIGFDAISTTAEECENPQRDLPKAMMWAIIICTVVYIAIALVLTGMVPYHTLGVSDPLAFVFDSINLRWMSGIIAVSAVVALASVLLVFQMGQPRIWMSMSRDGLMPKKFSRIHPKYHTPSYATIVTGFVVAVPALFMNFEMVTDLCSIGTLFAFVLVCAGVLKLHQTPNAPKGSFKTPYINSAIAMPILILVAIVVTLTAYKEECTNFLVNAPELVESEEFVTSLNKEEITTSKAYLTSTTGIKVTDLEEYLGGK